MPAAPSNTLIFDFDGTLADSLEIHRQIYNVLAQKYQRPLIAPENIDDLRHLSMREFLRTMQISLWRLPLFLRQARQIQREQKLEPDIFPGIAELIAMLAPHYQLGILTSNTVENVERFLQVHEIRQHFSWIMSEKALFSKTQKLRSLQKRYHLDPQKTCYVGDEVRDIEAAKAAGFPVVAVSWGFNSHKALVAAKPRAIIDSPAQLQQFL